MYAKVPKIPDFPALEHRILDQWEERRTFARLRERNQGGEPWSFLDGPITANNPMGVHHAWGRTYKDTFQRYHAMHGRDQRWQNGFDCQGLWVEVEVEKELGFQNKQDILSYGLDTFVRKCKQRVLKYAAVQTRQSIRLGYWMDWDDPATLGILEEAIVDDAQVTVTMPSGLELTDRAGAIVAQLGSPEAGGSYFTFSTENNLTIWQFLKRCWEQGYLYRGVDAMPWCSRCGTGISQMEVAEGRRITSHESVFIRLPLQGQDQEALLVWTTTPWTLPANVAAAVNPEMDYVRVKHGEWTYIIGKENLTHERKSTLRAGEAEETQHLPTIATILKGMGGYEVVGELKGAELVGLNYTGPFDNLPCQAMPGGLTPEEDRTGPTAIECHRVVPWDYVSGTEGTGIVHIAPGCGAEDFQLAKEMGLVPIAPLSESGHFLEGLGEWTGRHVGDLAQELVQDLRQRGVLLSRESYKHVYPHCWRCKEELVFRMVEEWFISMDWRERIAALVPQIRWIPPDGAAREKDWLKNMGDWMISKKRFWGLALPIWVDEETGDFEVIGSLQELEERAVAGWDEFAGHTPHRPWIDKVVIENPKNGNRMHRVADVGNPWLDAGIVPYSTMHFNTDQTSFEKWFPADLVTECFPGQFRNWFYVLLAMSAMMSDRPPFKTLLGHALVRDEYGRPMHKSDGNSIAFDEAADLVGAEVLRYMFVAQNPVTNLNFPNLGTNPSKPRDPQRKHRDDEVRRHLLTLWNCYNFYITYASADQVTAEDLVSGASERTDLDRWILSKQQDLVATAHRCFKDYRLNLLMERFERFLDELSNWYLRRSRRRFWKTEGDADQRAAYATLHQVLETTVRLMAPILPFLTEEIWQNLRTAQPDWPDSVHLAAYPQVDEGLIDNDLEARVDAIISLRNQGLALRNQAGIKVRQPLASLTVRPRPDYQAMTEALSDDSLKAHLLEELNVKDIISIKDETGMVDYSITPNFKVLGKKLGARMKVARGIIEALDGQKTRETLASGLNAPIEIDGETIELGREDLKIESTGSPGTVVMDSDGTFTSLDIALTPELEAEGQARDVVRHVQELRKSTGLQVEDRIDLTISCSQDLWGRLGTWKAYIEAEVLADSFSWAESITGAGREFKIAGEAVVVALTRRE